LDFRDIDGFELIILMALFTGNIACSAANPPKTYLEGRLTFARKEHCHTVFPLCMNTDESSLGRCPDCDERISESRLLIEFEKDDGTSGAWAECPSCEKVVAPE